VITSLDDAWRWYESARTLTLAMQRLGRRRWRELPWEGNLGRDEHLKQLDSADIENRSRAILDDLDDFCVLFLFSVFEASVRARVLTEVEAELPALRHAALKRAVLGMKEDIEHGSFFRVLEGYNSLDANLIEEVNQVRRYRNWVAHGRRGEQPAAVDPPAALNRLRRFLERCLPAADGLASG
jgi:hypothetical protein